MSMRALKSIMFSIYSITSLGMSLIPIIDAMLEWGNKNKDVFEKKYGR